MYWGTRPQVAPHVALGPGLQAGIQPTSVNAIISKQGILMKAFNETHKPKCAENIGGVSLGLNSNRNKGEIYTRANIL